MKKILILFMLLFIPFTVNAKEYKVTSHIIDTEIEIAGGLRIEELIVVEGETNFLSRTLNYYSFGENKWNGKNVNLENGAIYNGQGISINSISAYEFTEKVTFGEFTKNIKEKFTELDLENPKDNTYTFQDNKNGTANLKIFYPVKENKKIAFYLNYTVTNVSVKHNDIKELNYTFRNLNFDAKETILRVIIPYPTDSNLYHVWLHGNQSGKVQEITNDSNQKVGIIGTFPKVNDSINVRMTLPSEQIGIDMTINDSKIDALDEIIKIENKRLDNTERSNQIIDIMKYVLIGIGVLYVLASFMFFKIDIKPLYIIYLLFGLFIIIFNFLFKFNYWYLYLIILAPILVKLIRKLIVK